MPHNQQQFGLLFTQLRSMGHILERSSHNIGQPLSRPQSRAYTTDTFHATDYQPVPPAEQSLDLLSRGDIGAGNMLTDLPAMAGPTPAFPAMEVSPPPAPYAGDSGTDTDTISSVAGGDNLDDDMHLTPGQQQHERFWAYERAKSRWRKFMNKPSDVYGASSGEPLALRARARASA